MTIRKAGILFQSVASIALVCAVTSCGGLASSPASSANSAAAAPTAIKVTVSPASVVVPTINTKQFTATVSGSTNIAVTWSVNGIAGGNQTFGAITNDGLYTAPQLVPTPSSFTITANSQAAPAVSASADVTIVSSISLSISPSDLAVLNGNTQQFTVGVSGPIDSGVVWNVNGIPGGDATVGTIATTGTASRTILALYTAPSAPPATEPVTIKAISTVDSASVATARVTVKRDNQVGQSYPVKLGTSGGNVSDLMISGNMIGCCSGTLGSLVSRGGTFYILSNNHVLDKSGQGQPGDPISQPGLGDASCRVQNTGTVAHLSQAAPLQGTPANVDAAIAEIVPGTVDINGAILDLAGANQPAPPSATLADPSSVLSSNESVAKVGRSSGLTCSTVFSVGTDVTVNYPTSCGSSTKFQVTYTNQVIINGASFSAAGDSGSLIVTADTARPVGLLFAGNGTQTIANPIQTVLSALKDPNSGETPRMVGGADHPVACPAIGQSEITPAGALSLTSQLDAGLNQRATAARTAHMVELMQDPGVSQIVTGASDDDPSQPAIVLHVNGILQRPIPHQIEGVRTKVVFDDTGAPQPRVGAAEIVRAAQVKAQHAAELMSKAEVFGVGMGPSSDSPGEAAIVIYVDRNSSTSIPAEIDGTRTRIVRTDPFQTSGWGKAVQNSCSRN